MSFKEDDWYKIYRPGFTQYSRRFCFKNIWKNNFGKDSKDKIFVVSDTNNKMISPFKINEQKYTFIGAKDLFDYQDFIYSDHIDIDELLESYKLSKDSLIDKEDIEKLLLKAIHM